MGSVSLECESVFAGFENTRLGGQTALVVQGHEPTGSARDMASDDVSPGVLANPSQRFADSAESTEPPREDGQVAGVGFVNHTNFADYSGLVDDVKVSDLRHD